MQFGTGTPYMNPMDRDYGVRGDYAPGSSGDASTSTNDVGIGIKDLGMSVGLGPVPNVQAVAAKFRAGTKNVELAFMGQGKGSGQGHTPGMYGLKQRVALAEVGKVNQVDFTTHATVGVYGVAGMDQQGNFSKQSKDFSLQEIRRAIEFAGDVAKGGPVVVHTGEFQRPVVDASWNQKEGDKYKDKFQLYEGEEERASYRVVDTRTGGVIQEARKNRKVARPVWMKYKEGDKFWKEHGGKEYTDSRGNKVTKNDYIDYFGNKLEPAERVPVFNKTKDHFEVKQMDWNDLVEEAEELTTRAQAAFRNWGNMTEAQKKESIWRERIKEAKEKGISASEIKVMPEEAYIIATLETNAAHSRGWAYSYGGEFDEYVDKVDKIKRAIKIYKKIEEETDPEMLWTLKKQARDTFGGLVPEDAELPTEILNKQLRGLDNRMQQAREAASSQWAQAEEAMETIRHVKNAEDYALDEAYDSYARSAIAAMKQTEKLRDAGELKNNKPVQVAMENLFPETYGAHPDELKRLILGSRNKMAQLLKNNYKISEHEAKKRAQEHITGTLDTGHLNMWRKYWKGDPTKTIKENDAEFDKWMIDKVTGLAKDNIIGHVHIVDNFGFQDDHIAPGEGNTPIRDMIKALKDNGFKGEMIVEPGADYSMDTSGFSTVTKAWRYFGSPVYGAGSGGGGTHSSRNWNQVGYGWFGQNNPPYFTFGGYGPSEDWTLWSGVPLE